MPGKNTGSRACNFQSIARLEMAGRPFDCGSRHAQPRASSEHQPKFCLGGWQIGPWQRSSESRNVKATSGRPVAPPPPAAAQAAAPNRQQNAGMENLIPTVVAKTSPISRLEPIPIHLPTPPAHSGGTVTAGVENCEQTSRLPLFHLVPAGTAAAAD